jgi:dihydromethanopterin reductase (acceptor)
MKLAWGFTGAGHFLNESVDILEQLIMQGNKVDIFISDAAEKVMEMYGVLNRVQQLQKTAIPLTSTIFFERQQRPAYPISARFNLKHYKLLILSPLSANSVAKINVGIADTLITNDFAQMIKGGGEVFVVPSDIIAGEIETTTPQGGKIKIHIDEFNAQNARALAKFPGVQVFQSPAELLQALGRILKPNE